METHVMMKELRALKLAASASAGLTCLAASGLAAAEQTQEPMHEHRHLQQSAAIRNLQLDEGRKWATDAPLRTGMAAIREAFDADHPAIHAGTETDPQYAALAGRIESQVHAIVAQCKLPPAADANLHYLIADLTQGVSLMQGADPARSRHDGAALVHHALLAYGEYFDDPGFAPEAPVHGVEKR
jgi:hypothetical protein